MKPSFELLMMLCAAIAAAAVIYLFGVFSMADFNIAQWSQDERAFIALFMLVAAMAAMPAIAAWNRGK